MHHLTLRVADIPATREFYVDTLGFRVVREIPHRELWLTVGNDSLVFLHSETAVQQSSSALDHFGFVVPKKSDVAAWETYLRQKQVGITQPTELYDDESVGLKCADPSGNCVEVLWHPSIVPRLGATRDEQEKSGPLNLLAVLLNRFKPPHNLLEHVSIRRIRRQSTDQSG